MSTASAFVAGIGAGLLIAAFVIKLFDVAWIVVTVGPLLVVLAAVAGSRQARGGRSGPAREAP